MRRRRITFCNCDRCDRIQPSGSRSQVSTAPEPAPADCRTLSKSLRPTIQSGQRNPIAQTSCETVSWVGVSSNQKEAAVEFFNLKTKRKVEIPDKELKK